MAFFDDQTAMESCDLAGLLTLQSFYNKSLTW